MFPFTKSKAGFSSLRQDSEYDEEAEGKLDQSEYVEKRNISENRRFWSSNVPWIFTTLALSLYIIAYSIFHKQTCKPSTSTDFGK
jgi:hypothetical protein